MESGRQRVERVRIGYGLWVGDFSGSKRNCDLIAVALNTLGKGKRVKSNAFDTRINWSPSGDVR